MVGRDYLPDLLLQVGSSLLLLIPLVVLNRMLERRLESAEREARSISSDLADVRSQVRRTAARIDTLGVDSPGDVAKVKRRRTEAFERLGTNPTADGLGDLLSYAAHIAATPADGLRARLPGEDVWLRMTTAEDGVTVTAERRDGEPITSTTWRDPEPARALLARVRTSAGAEPGRDDGPVLTELVRTLRLAVESRTGDRPHDLGQVIESCGAQWVVAADGLRCVDRSYHVPTDRLLGPAEDWIRHMATQPWVDQVAFAEAHRTAVDLARRSRGRSTTPGL
jgi:hypothetical protein